MRITYYRMEVVATVILLVATIFAYGQRTRTPARPQLPALRTLGPEKPRGTHGKCVSGFLGPTRAGQGVYLVWEDGYVELRLDGQWHPLD